MRFVLALLLRLLTSRFRSNADLEIELLVARQQLAIYQRSVRRPRLRRRDRLFWGGLSRLWSRWQDVLVIVKPATELGQVIEFPEVGGLHHRYERRAA